MRVFQHLIIFLCCLSSQSAFAHAGQLISYTKVGYFFPAEIIDAANTLANQEVLENEALGTVIDTYLNYPVDFYEVVYLTEEDGELIEVSGLAIVPIRYGQKWPILSYQHGTILPELAHTCPSNFHHFDFNNPFKSSFEVSLIGAVAASHGYVVAMPDYIGFGVSADRPANYTYTPSLASVSRDMLRAVDALAWEEDIPLNGELFLAGYSEGAGATMALHRMLEKDPHQEFVVTAQSSGAGFFNYSRMCREFAVSTHESLAAPLYLWSCFTLNREHPALGYPQKELFRHKYRNIPKSLFSWRVMRMGAKTAENLLHPKFRSSLVDGSDPNWQEAARANDHYDWRAKAPVFLHHGGKDLVLPAFHSQDAYEHMTARGSDVKLTVYPEDSHFSLIDNFLFATLNEFDAIREAKAPRPESVMP